MQRVLDDVPDPGNIARQRTVENHRLDAIWRLAWPGAEQGDVASLRVLLEVSRRRSALNGLNKPTMLQLEENNNQYKSEPLRALEGADLGLCNLLSLLKLTLFDADLVIVLLLRHPHNSLREAWLYPIVVSEQFRVWQRTREALQPLDADYPIARPCDVLAQQIRGRLDVGRLLLGLFTRRRTF